MASYIHYQNWQKNVKQLLDYMVFYKLNRFHCHLTDKPIGVYR